MRSLQQVVSSFLIVILTSVISYYSFAQETISEEKFFQFDAGADLVSRYIWRGTSEGDAPYIMPWIEMSLGRNSHKFNLLIDASQPFIKDDPFQFDIGASYCFKDAVKITLTDYFVADDPVEGAGYLNYNEITGNHILEVSAAWEGTGKFPARLMAGYNFYGADPDRSIYLEAGYKAEPFAFFLGMTPRTGMYHTEDGFGFSFVNIGFTFEKEIPVSAKFRLPFFTSLIVNPQAERVYLVAGISL